MLRFNVVAGARPSFVKVAKLPSRRNTVSKSGNRSSVRCTAPVMWITKTHSGESYR